MSYIANDDPLKKSKPTLSAKSFIWFHRLVAVLCMIIGIGYWSKLIGFEAGGAARFDLMPVHLQVAATSLSILLPVASVGLWMVVSWGPVVWVAAAITEIIMYGVYPQLFGQKPLLIVSHIAIAVLYLVFWLVLNREAREAAR